MIVNYTEHGWNIIAQPAHGLLAAEICAHWKATERPCRWVETILATAAHDDVYNEFEDEDLLNEAGGPRDFKQSVFRSDYCERLLKMARARSLYIALLTSRHIQFVYGNDPAAFSFLKKLKKEETGSLKILGMKRKEVSQAYLLMQFCDAFSLMVCQGLIAPEGRQTEISEGPGGKRYFMASTGSNQIQISPWPFESQEFILRWESRLLDKLKFEELADFNISFAQASVVQHELLVHAG